jgi:UDP-glucose 4-epimerase
MIKKRIILVTGCSGFIGSHLCEKLIKNHKVIGIDNESIGSKKNISQLLKESKNFTYLKFDLNNSKLKEKIKDVDTIYHLAAMKLNDSSDNILLIKKNNVHSIKNILKAVNVKKIKKIIFTSSLYVYDKSNKKKFEFQKCKPYTNYGKSKLIGEKIFKKFVENKKIQLIIFRLFFTYGLKQYSGQGYPSVIYKTIKRIILNKSPIIKNNGEQQLDYTHINDVIRALLIALNNKNSATYNISTEKTISINNLIKKILKVTNSKLKPIYHGSDKTIGTIKIGSNKKIQDTLGWKPRIKIDYGIKEIFKNLK